MKHTYLQVYANVSDLDVVHRLVVSARLAPLDRQYHVHPLIGKKKPPSRTQLARPPLVAPKPLQGRMRSNMHLYAAHVLCADTRGVDGGPDSSDASAQPLSRTYTFETIPGQAIARRPPAYHLGFQ